MSKPLEEERERETARPEIPRDSEWPSQCVQTVLRHRRRWVGACDGSTWKLFSLSGVCHSEIGGEVMN